MNVYDFDKTIYDGDSTLDFYKFCLCKQPSLIACLPKQLKFFLKYKVGKCDKKLFKEAFYCFLVKIENIEEVVESFWDKNELKIKKWYKKQKETSDIIISASPEFLLKPVCTRLNVRVIASQVNPKNGRYTGENCYGEEKVRCYKREFGEKEIHKFYTDCESDAPLAKIATESYLVKGEKVLKYKF